MAEIAKNPAAFDGKPVFVTGTAGEISSRTSRRGNRSTTFTTFTLSDQGEAVKVFTFGTPTIKDGDRVEVSGVFQRDHVGPSTFYDVIEAGSVSPVK